MGTTTFHASDDWQVEIIPLREKIGNYDPKFIAFCTAAIIPLREKIGNYDFLLVKLVGAIIIPLREKIGNYDSQSKFPKA